VAAARLARLRYVSDERTPGISRRRAGTGFAYRGPDEQPIRDPAVLKRIRALVIPPAWTDVWICADPNGHIQATGRDAKGRKQYRYHDRFREVREEAKFERTIAFARALPQIRERVERDLRRQGMPREKVIAVVVKLLEDTLIRVGNEEYAKQNRSYGLTTLRNRHVKVQGSALTFRFKGKAGNKYDIALNDRRLARAVKHLQELPGQHLFQYGQPHVLESDDVNEYLREASGQDFTAKDFRTWAATVLACDLLSMAEDVSSPTAAKRNVTNAIKQVARDLGNTPAVCRRSYVHPGVIDAFLDGSMLHAITARAQGELDAAVDGPTDREARVLQVLEQRMQSAVKAAAAKSAAA